MKDLGIINPGSTQYFDFDSFASSTGAPITITGLAVGDIKVYKDGGTTERASTSGYTLLDTDGIDFDAITGIHGFSIDLADNTTADFWQSGSHYRVVLSTITVDGQTMSFTVATFRIGYANAVLNTFLATLTSQTSFTLNVGPAEDDALKGMWAIIHDAASAVQKSIVQISAYTGSTKTVTLAAGATFTVAAKDNISIMAPMPVQPTVPGRTLDISSGGEAGIDWANIGSPTTAQNLSSTNIDPDQVVASVTGAVGSVSGAVGSVTGNVGGSVGSVVGAVGSVTGNVGGNVSGSVNSVTSDVGITQAGADKVWATTVRTLSAAGVQAIWDALTSALTTVGSVGKKLADWVVGTAQTGDSYAVVSDVSHGNAALKTLIDAADNKLDDLLLEHDPIITGLSITDAAPTTTSFDTDLVASVDDFYKDALVKFVTGAANYGVARPVLSSTAAGLLTFDEPWPVLPVNGDGFVLEVTHIHSVADIADRVWDEATAGHSTAGTTGKALTDAGNAGDPWGTPLPGAYNPGEAGYILGTNLDAKVSELIGGPSQTIVVGAGLNCNRVQYFDAGEVKPVGSHLEASTGTLTISAVTVTLQDADENALYAIDGLAATGFDPGGLTLARAWYLLDSASPPADGPIAVGTYSMVFHYEYTTSDGLSRESDVPVTIKVS